MRDRAVRAPTLCNAMPGTCPRYWPKIVLYIISCVCTLEVYRAFGCISISPLRYFAHTV